MPLRRLSALAELLLLRATGGAAVQGVWRLLLPGLLRQPDLREPAQECEGEGLAAGLQASAASRRLAAGRRCHSAAPAWHGAEDLRAALFKGRATRTAAGWQPGSALRATVDRAADVLMI